MSFEFKEEHLAAMIPTNRNVSAWYKAMEELFPKYDITTPNRIAGFIAQCAHESNNFNSLEENLNYSEDALLRVFSRYFGSGKRNAKEYARNPEKIANYVYMDEFRSKSGALGNTRPGDGWKFRGRGLKQLTGRNNYEAFGRSIDLTADEAAEYVATERGAIESACWFWKTNRLNAIADKGDIVAMTKKINGGTIGLEDRERRWKQALEILNGNSRPAPSSSPKPVIKTNYRTLSVGDRGDDVAKMQEVLKINADGIFGPATKRAVKAFQQANGLVADGIAGPKTLTKLLG